MAAFGRGRQVARVTPVILIGLCLSTATLLLFTVSGQRHIDRCLSHLAQTAVPAQEELNLLHESLSSAQRAAMLAQAPHATAVDQRRLASATSELDALVTDYGKMAEPDEREDWNVLAGDLHRYLRELNQGSIASIDALHLRTRGLHQAVRAHSARKDALEVSELVAANRVQHTDERRTIWVLVLFAGMCAVALLRARWLERAEVERENALISRLEQTNADLNAFAGRIAHDLRSPLTPILTGSQMIQVAEVPDVVRDMAARIAGSAKRLGAMIDALLLFSRTTGRPVTDACCEVRSAAHELRRTLAEHITASEARLVIDVPDDVVVACEPELVHALMQNLVENALKYGLDGSPDRAIWVRARRQGTSAVIEVEDHGPGVPQDVMDKIFQPFVQASHPPSGVGLGLAIVHRLAVARSGAIEVRPAQPRGSCFRLRLPLAERGPRVAANAAWSHPSR